MKRGSGLKWILILPLIHLSLHFTVGLHYHAADSYYSNHAPFSAHVKDAFQGDFPAVPPRDNCSREIPPPVVVDTIVATALLFVVSAPLHAVPPGRAPPLA